MKDVPAGCLSFGLLSFLEFHRLSQSRRADVVTLKDGSTMYGEAIETSAGAFRWGSRKPQGTAICGEPA